jgi:hypothetical protein
MSYTDLDSLEPIPGDLIVALHVMRAWEEEDRRGKDGTIINEGEQALVLASWNVGNKRRFKLFRNDRILTFSCFEHCVRRNWKVARAAPRLPTTGCP